MTATKTSFLGTVGTFSTGIVICFVNLYFSLILKSEKKYFNGGNYSN